MTYDTAQQLQRTAAMLLRSTPGREFGCAIHARGQPKIGRTRANHPIDRLPPESEACFSCLFASSAESVEARNRSVCEKTAFLRPLAGFVAKLEKPQTGIQFRTELLLRTRWLFSLAQSAGSV